MTEKNEEIANEIAGRNYLAPAAVETLAHWIKLALDSKDAESAQLREERDNLEKLVHSVNDALSEALAEIDTLKKKSSDYEEALTALVIAQDERLSLKYGANRPEFGVWLWDKARHVLSEWVAPK